MGILTNLVGFANQTYSLFTGKQRYQRVDTANISGQNVFKGRFRSYKWDPMLIIAQIIAMQCFFYTSLGILTASINAIAGNKMSIDYIFLSENVHFQMRPNQIIVIAHVLNSLCGAVGLWFIVQRAKQCLDFACTLHLLHLIFCWIYSRHFPLSLTWWLVQISCVILMVVSGEYLCFRTELKAIPVIGARADV